MSSKNIVIGSDVIVSLASRSAVAGQTGIVIGVNPKDDFNNDEIIVKVEKAGKVQVGYVRRKLVFLSKIENLTGHYVESKDFVADADGDTHPPTLLALCTDHDVEADELNIVFMGTYAVVKSAEVVSLGKQKPDYFGKV